MIRRDLVRVYREVALMRQRFPSFRGQCSAGEVRWHGTLQPQEASPVYAIQIVYLVPKVPNVWVVHPVLHPNTPHRYPDRSLCLYYPGDRSWHPDAGIALTIVPWTAEWLFFYEYWVQTGRWLGVEAPHQGEK
jgi:hypothetical protein